jgi:hypothetical protein
MLSTQYRLRLEFICSRIENHEEVKLEDMIWAEKLAKANRSAATMLRQARRKAVNPNMTEDSMDGFLNALDLGYPDPTQHRTRFDSADDIVDFFHNDDDGMRRD